MKLSTNNFTSAIRQIIVGGKSAIAGGVAADAGFLKDVPSILGASTSAAAETALPVEAFHIPRDYDEGADNLFLKVQGQSAGATDTPALTVTVTRVRVGVADATLTTAAALFTASTAQQSATIDLSSNDLLKDDALLIAITAGAHTTDALDQLVAVPTYRSTLVSYNQVDSSGNPLR